MVSMPTTPREAGSAGFELPPRICLVAPSASRELRASPSSSGSHGAPARGDDAKHGARARAAVAIGGDARRRRTAGVGSRACDMLRSGADASPPLQASARRRVSGLKRSTRCSCTAWSWACAGGGRSLPTRCFSTAAPRLRCASSRPCDQRPRRRSGTRVRPLVGFARGGRRRACELLLAGRPCPPRRRVPPPADAWPARIAGGVARPEVLPQAGGGSRQEPPRLRSSRAGARRGAACFFAQRRTPQRTR